MNLQNFNDFTKQIGRISKQRYMKQRIFDLLYDTAFCFVSSLIPVPKYNTLCCLNSIEPCLYHAA